MDQKYITITMEEYKELLQIKGKYQELKSQQTSTPLILKEPTLTKFGDEKIEEYKITC